MARSCRPSRFSRSIGSIFQFFSSPPPPLLEIRYYSTRVRQQHTSHTILVPDRTTAVIFLGSVRFRFWARGLFRRQRTCARVARGSTAESVSPRGGSKQISKCPHDQRRGTGGRGSSGRVIVYVSLFFFPRSLRSSARLGSRVQPGRTNAIIPDGRDTAIRRAAAVSPYLYLSTRRRGK